jgi:hypothetical protein
MTLSGEMEIVWKEAVLLTKRLAYFEYWIAHMV